MRPERDYLILGKAVLSEVKFAIYYCAEFCIVKVDSYHSELKAFGRMPRESCRMFHLKK